MEDRESRCASKGPQLTTPVVGTDFDVSFLDWLFDRRDKLAAPAEPEPEAVPEVADAPAESSAPGPSAGSRMFASAVEGTKRKFENTGDEQNKRRVPDNAPTGPRGGPQGGPQPGRSLSDRLGPRGGGPGGLPHRGGLNVRGAANGRVGHMNGPGFGPGPRHQQPGFRPQGFPGQGFAPGQQEMMMQMMAMQANMVAMAEQMANMQQQVGTLIRVSANPLRTDQVARPPHDPQCARRRLRKSPLAPSLAVMLCHRSSLGEVRSAQFPPSRRRQLFASLVSAAATHAVSTATLRLLRTRRRVWC